MFPSWRESFISVLSVLQLVDAFDMWRCKYKASTTTFQLHSYVRIVLQWAGKTDISTEKTPNTCRLVQLIFFWPTFATADFVYLVDGNLQQHLCFTLSYSSISTRYAVDPTCVIEVYTPRINSHITLAFADLSVARCQASTLWGEHSVCICVCMYFFEYVWGCIKSFYPWV